MKKKLITVFVVLTLFIFLYRIAGNVQAVRKVQLSQTNLTLKEGEKKKLNVTGTKKKVIWTVNKKSVASVTKKGVVKAKKKGNAVITAKVGKRSYQCKVDVIENTSLKEEQKEEDTQTSKQPDSVSMQDKDKDTSSKPAVSDDSIVYMTSEISPESLLKVYESLAWSPTGKVAVKLSTGEPPASNYLKAELIKDLVQSLDGTIVECNTAYGGSRSETAMHYQVAKDHGFTEIADVKILDEDGSISIPVENGTQLSENYVGKAFTDYDSYLVLSHFKGHAMAGFGGAIKNISIGLGSSKGKSWIHSGGNSKTNPWGGDQDEFLEAMGDAGKSVSDYLKNGERIVYINVMNRLSVDCDCDGNPAEPDMHDIGILASTDSVALDQACIDLIYEQKDGDGASLVRRIESRNGLHTLEHAEEIGLGSRTYQLVKLDD